TYSSSSKSFECSCGYTQFSGFICHHIFRAAVQLNLEELPTSLFCLRWRKNMSELELAQWYYEFYSTTTVDSTILYSTITYKNQEQDQNFLLTRLLNKIQRFTKETHILQKNSINNPLIAKTKGAPKKRKTPDVEKQLSKKSKPINKQE
ncbi:11652_t:CDS:2, partial [Gigaspora rosea]